MEDFELLSVLSKGEEAFQYYRLHEPDLVILDILLQGEWNGIETAERINEHRPTGIIFLTSLNDTATFQKAKARRPYAFLTKPLEPVRLQQAMELTITHLSQPASPLESSVQPDYAFVRVGNRMIKIRWEDVAWLTVEGKHTRLHLDAQKGYEVRMSLKELEEKLTGLLFYRIHRSTLINLRFLESYNASEVTIKGNALPIGRYFKDAFLKQVTTLRIGE